MKHEENHDVEVVLVNDGIGYEFISKLTCPTVGFMSLDGIQALETDALEGDFTRVAEERF